MSEFITDKDAEKLVEDVIGLQAIMIYMGPNKERREQLEKSINALLEKLTGRKEAFKPEYAAKKIDDLADEKSSIKKYADIEEQEDLVEIARQFPIKALYKILIMRDALNSANKANRDFLDAVRDFAFQSSKISVVDIIDSTIMACAAKLEKNDEDADAHIRASEMRADTDEILEKVLSHLGNPDANAKDIGFDAETFMRRPLL